MAIHRLKSRFVDTVTRAGMYSDGAGLYLQVGQGGGAKSWIFRYNRSRFGKGGEAHMGLGPAHTISLDEAREFARECRQQILKGIDPMEAREAERLAKRLEESKHVTFAFCATDYLTFKSSGPRAWVPRTANATRRWIRKHLIPVLGDLPITTIDHVQLADILNRIGDTTPKTAEMIRGHLEAIFDRAKAKGYRTGDNPASMKGPLGILLHEREKNVQNHPSVPHEKIGAIMAELRTPRSKSVLGYTLAEAAEATGVDRSAILVSIQQGKLPASKQPGAETKYNSSWFIQPTELNKLYPLKKAPTEQPPISIEAYLLQFTILTAVRPSESRNMRWNEIPDFETTRLWTIPWHRLKTRKMLKEPHEIALSEPAMRILKTMQATQGTDGVTSEFVFAQWSTARLAASIGKPPSDATVRDYLARITNVSIAAKFTVHGFRSTFSTWAHEDGRFKHNDIEMALSHLPEGNKVSHVYNKAKRAEARRQLMEAWAEYCGRTEPLPAEVVPFRQAK
jgi:integrase